MQNGSVGCIVQAIEFRSLVEQVNVLVERSSEQARELQRLGPILARGAGVAWEGFDASPAALKKEAQRASIEEVCMPASVSGTCQPLTHSFPTCKNHACLRRRPYASFPSPHWCS